MVQGKGFTIDLNIRNNRILKNNKVIGHGLINILFKLDFYFNRYPIIRIGQVMTLLVGEINPKQANPWIFLPDQMKG